MFLENTLFLEQIFKRTVFCQQIVKHVFKTGKQFQNRPFISLPSLSLLPIPQASPTHTQNARLQVFKYSDVLYNKILKLRQGMEKRWIKKGASKCACETEPDTSKTCRGSSDSP